MHRTWFLGIARVCLCFRFGAFVIFSFRLLTVVSIWVWLRSRFAEKFVALLLSSMSTDLFLFVPKTIALVLVSSELRSKLSKPQALKFRNSFRDSVSR